MCKMIDASALENKLKDKYKTIGLNDEQLDRILDLIKSLSFESNLNESIETTLRLISEDYDIDDENETYNEKQHKETIKSNIKSELIVPEGLSNSKYFNLIKVLINSKLMPFLKSGYRRFRISGEILYVIDKYGFDLYRYNINYWVTYTLSRDLIDSLSTTKVDSSGLTIYNYNEDGIKVCMSDLSNPNDLMIELDISGLNKLI